MDVEPKEITINVEAARELGPRLRYVMGELVPEWIERQRRKAAQYGDSNHAHLGVRGQYSDIWRKIGPLERALWDGEDTAGWSEQPREILMDLIGHCLLTIELLDRQDPARNPDFTAGTPEEQLTVHVPGHGQVSGPRTAYCKMMSGKAESRPFKLHYHTARCVLPALEQQWT